MEIQVRAIFPQSMITYIKMVHYGQKYSESRAKVSSASHALGRAIAGVSLSMREEWQGCKAP